jgi:pimeloyl-ACP methyl ester carboxylesterase
LVLLVSTGTATGQPAELVGPWSGYIYMEATGLEVPVTLRLSNEGGSLSAVAEFHGQGSVAVDTVEVNGEAIVLQIELPTGPIRFEGRLGQGTLTGVLTQSGQAGTFSLTNVEMDAVGPPPERETFPEPTDYRQEEVTFSHGDVTLAGTLTLPLEGGPFPALLLITGSGSQTRDENVYGFRIFRVLAEHLTRNGIAVLRYDDRGVGRSTGGTPGSTTRDFADDAAAGVRLLRAHAQINGEQIGLLGHSEGGLVASMVASELEPVAFVILMASPPVSGYEVRLAQMRAEARLEGASEAELQQALDLQRRAMDAALAGDDMAPYVEELVQLAATLGDLSEEDLAAAREQAAAQLESIRNPWYLHFLAYDPGPALSSLACPVLAIFGELDVQVPPAFLQEPMASVLAGNPNATVEVVPGANHLFQAANTGHYNEYASLDPAFTPGFLELVTSWIQAQTSTR